MRSFVPLFALQCVVYLEFGRRVCVAALDWSTHNLLFVAKVPMSAPMELP